MTVSIHLAALELLVPSSVFIMHSQYFRWQGQGGSLKLDSLNGNALSGFRKERSINRIAVRVFVLRVRHSA